MCDMYDGVIEKSTPPTESHWVVFALHMSYYLVTWTSFSVNKNSNNNASLGNLSTYDESNSFWGRNALYCRLLSIRLPESSKVTEPPPPVSSNVASENYVLTM